MTDFDLFGIKYNGSDYYGSTAVNAIQFSGGDKLSSITVAPLKLPATTDLDDPDNDAFSATPISITTPLLGKWYYNNGGSETVFYPSATDSFCSLLATKPGPYRFEISGNLILSTQYGDPLTQNFNGIKKSYTIDMENMICYARPNLEYGIGPHIGPASIWDPSNGFLAQSGSSSFPSTGFYNARFDLIFNDAMSYNWSATQGGAIIGSLTKSAGKVTVVFAGARAGATRYAAPYPALSGGGNYPVTITGTKAGADNVSYSFTIKKWFINNGGTPVTIAVARNYCNTSLGGGYRLPSIIDLTDVIKGSARNNYFRVFGSLFSEWGYTNDPNVSGGGSLGMDYTGSGFRTDYKYYWTNDDYDGTGYWQTTVMSSNGGISGYRIVGPGNLSSSVVCTIP